MRGVPRPQRCCPALRRLGLAPYALALRFVLGPSPPSLGSVGTISLFEEAMREADLPAEQPEAQEKARVPSPDEEPCRSGRAQVAPGARARPDLGLIHRVRSRARFSELSRARPHKDGPVWVRRVGGPGSSPPEVAYAIGRNVGNAVTRNRLRRQLRSIMRTHIADLSPGSAYLVGVTDAGRSASFSDLAIACQRCLGSSRG